MEERDLMEERFKELKWPYIPSGANFIFVKPLDQRGNASAEIANSHFSTSAQIISCTISRITE